MSLMYGLLPAHLSRKHMNYSSSTLASSNAFIIFAAGGLHSEKWCKNLVVVDLWCWLSSRSTWNLITVNPISFVWCSFFSICKVFYMHIFSALFARLVDDFCPMKQLLKTFKWCGYFYATKSTYFINNRFIYIDLQNNLWNSVFRNLKISQTEMILQYRDEIRSIDVLWL